MVYGQKAECNKLIKNLAPGFQMCLTCKCSHCSKRILSAINGPQIKVFSQPLTSLPESKIPILIDGYYLGAGFDPRRWGFDSHLTFAKETLSSGNLILVRN